MCFEHEEKTSMYWFFFVSVSFKSICFFVYYLFKKREKRKKEMVNFKIYDVTTWLTNIDNTHIAQYLMKLATWCCIARFTLNYQRCVRFHCYFDFTTSHWCCICIVNIKVTQNLRLARWPYNDALTGWCKWAPMLLSNKRRHLYSHSFWLPKRTYSIYVAG